MILRPRQPHGGDRAVWDREMDEETLSLLEGLHFHTLCEQNADASGRLWMRWKHGSAMSCPGCNG